MPRIAKYMFSLKKEVTQEIDTIHPPNTKNKDENQGKSNQVKFTENTKMAYSSHIDFLRFG